MSISLIIAVAENNVIGKDNQLIWRLSADLKNFKKLTTGHSILMGRKTFDSIGRALPNRHNIVITRSNELFYEGCLMAYGLQEAITIAKQLDGHEEIFVIGGANIYVQALPLVDKIYLTKVHAQPEGDAFFDLDLLKSWNEIDKTVFTKDEKNEYDFEIITLKKPD